jgi:sugar-specific transcriptional regulator TrmB
LTQFETIAKRMQDLGFTRYEAMAYISLLQHNPVTRYELSKNSGVPRSAIYNVITKLENLGAVSAQSSDPETYVPLPPDQLFELLEGQFKNRIEDARKDLKNIESKPSLDQFWNILGYENMILKARELIQKAEKNIFLSVWHREFGLLEKDLKEAVRRKINLTIFSFTEVKVTQARLFCYGLDEKELEKIWPHRIILIADKQEVLMGDADRLQKKKTVWTSNRALIGVALNHIIMDITLFGSRLNQPVEDAVIQMQNGETDYLGRLLKDRYPEIKF